MKKHEIINQILDPRKGNLGVVGIAFVAAAKKA